MLEEKMLNSEVNGKRPIPRIKSPAPLPESLNRRLASYAMAAAAAGAATLACSAPAEGEEVCRNISIQLSDTTTFALNPGKLIAGAFNVAQTTFSSFPSSGYYYFWWNRGFFTPNSAGANVLVDDTGMVADAASGALIGPDAKFGKGQSYGMMFTYGNGTFDFRAHGTLKKHRGNLNLQDANYIGFEFLLAGKIHYGWARLQVKFDRRQYYQTKAHIHFLGYGYETAPNTAIAAGSCAAESAGNTIGNGPSHANIDSTVGETGTGSNAPKSATLGMLAAGSAALPVWRKDFEQ
jgi:hypothetical protein